MNTAKAEVTSMLESLPDDASLEDIQYHLYVLEKVKKGVERAEQEGVVEQVVLDTHRLFIINKVEQGCPGGCPGHP